MNWIDKLTGKQLKLIIAGYFIAVVILGLLISYWILL